MRKLMIGGVMLLAACAPVAVQQDTAKVQTAVGGFLQRADASIVAACGVWNRAEANPLVQVALGVGTTAVNLVSGGTAGAVVASVKEYGDAFCAAGPPAGDTTTIAGQVSWLQTITNQLLIAAGAR